jgi:hypothetical protein
LGGILQITLRKANRTGQRLVHLCLMVIPDRPKGTCRGKQGREYRRQ